MREQLGQADDAQDYVVSGVSADLHNVLVVIIKLTLQGNEKNARALIDEYQLSPDIIETIKQEQKNNQRDQQRVRDLGGLHVIGTERHEARRIDNQLRGRAGRQGDPGSSRFFLSMEDELMRRFGGERVQNLMRRTWQEDTPLEFGILSRAVESAQTRVEGYNFDIRKHVIEYDDVINKQREVIYEQRREVLRAEDLRDQVLRMLQEEVAALVSAHCTGYDPDDWNLEGLYNALRAFLPAVEGGFLPTPESFSVEQWSRLSSEDIQEQLIQQTEIAYDLFYQSLGHQSFQEAMRQEKTLAQIRDSNDPLQRMIFQRVVKRLGDESDNATIERSMRRFPDDVKAKIEEGFIEATRVFRDRQIMLQAVDGLWIRHLTDLDILRQGIGLRAYGQRDPLVSFKKEAHEMYQGLLSAIQTNIVQSLFRVSAAPRPSPRSDRRQRNQKRRRRKRRR
jgi:preprotein translocase subunit SecA